MFKKNTRKRLLAGALATVMMLTMCPSWALAGDEDIAPLPLVDESLPVVDSAPVEVDTTKTPTDPTPSEPEAKPAENQNTAPAPSDDGANGDTNSAETGNSTNPTIPEGSENNSRKNNAADSTPDVNDQPQDAADINDVSMASLDVDAYSLNNVKTFEAEYWITNARATDENNVNTLPIRSDMAGITDEGGIPVNQLAKTRNNINGYETTVFWQARVLPVYNKQTTGLNVDKTASGTEIDAIRYYGYGDYGKSFQYRKKGGKKGGSWEYFLPTDQLVFYYLIRTGYSHKVQVDVSDWTVTEEPSDSMYPDHRGVNYQVIVDDDTVLDNDTFWYNRDLTVSAIRIRQTEAANYAIKDVVLEPDNLDKPTKNDNGEYQFSLNLRKTDHIATVKIYVSAKQYNLSYDENGGKITSSGYTQGEVYPDMPITVPTAKREGYNFDGWFDTKGKKYETGALMPGNDLKLTAKWTEETPNPEQKPKLTEAKYFVLLPTRSTPTSGASQGWTSYLPNDGSDGGVKGLTHDTGYKGFLKPEGQRMADENRTGDDSNGIYNVNGFGDDYLVPPTDLGFFTERNWSPDGTIYNSDKESNTTNPFSVLGTNFNVKNNISVVWYTIKYQADEGSYHVDGYVTGVPVTVTYHSNDRAISGTAEKTSVVDATSGDTYTVLDHSNNMFTAPNGYTFGGWYTEPDYTKGKKVAVGSTETLRTDWHLYAHWVPINSEVSYFYKNEQGTEMRFGDIDTYAFGDDVTVRTAHPEKEGYTFTCWTNIKNIVTVDANGQFKMPAENVRFDATFEINQYNVTYKVDGKEVGTDVYNFNSDVAIRPVPTKEGYTFTGWKIGTADAENFKMPAHDVTIEGTFAKNSSGGHHHRRPTVTIPDEVPTGLNGNDHYAYIVGYPDKTVRPQNGITRAEVATIFFRLLTDETRDANSTKSNSYSDVAAGAWYNHAVSTLSAMGIVKGDSDGKFNPNAPITRAEFAAIAARFDDKANSTTADFSDIASHWAKNEISAASNNGWINGYPDGTFRPDNKITRAEAMTLVNRVLKRLPETAEDLHDDMIKWSDNSDASQWFYLAVQEATNSHYYQTKENQFEKWSELRDTRDWTELEK